MKRLIIILLSIVSFVSCDSEFEKPDPFLDHDQMVDIMTDLSLAEGTRIYARANHLERIEGEYSINDYYAMILEKYNITRAELDSINSWYLNFPQENQQIYKDVLDSLNKLQANEASILKEEEKKRIEEKKLEKERITAKSDSAKLKSSNNLKLKK